jgi:hypothetical protein
MKYLLSAVLAMAFLTPALAAEFYVVQNPSTKSCTVVNQKPADSSVVVMGNGKVYTTRTEAETAVKTICTETTGSSNTTTTIHR